MVENISFSSDGTRMADSQDGAGLAHAYVHLWGFVRRTGPVCLQLNLRHVAEIEAEGCPWLIGIVQPGGV